LQGFLLQVEVSKIIVHEADQRLMRQFGIELADEAIEAFLLLQAVGAVAAETTTKGMAENLSIRLLDQPDFLIRTHGFVFDLQSCNLHDPR
jgi:hypothetical protein